MVLLGEKIPKSCLSISEYYQNVLAAILLLLGLFALLDNTIKTVLLIWIYLCQFLKRISQYFVTKAYRWIKALTAISCNKKSSTWKEVVLNKGHKNVSMLRFHCTLDPLRLTVNMNNLTGLKSHCPQDHRKDKSYHGSWPTHQDTDDEKASWYGHQQQHRQANNRPNQAQHYQDWESQSSSHHSDSDSPQPACPAGSTVSSVHFHTRSPEHVAKARGSLVDWGIYIRNPQRATGDKELHLNSAGETMRGQSFLHQSAVPSTEEPIGLHSECSAVHVHPQVSEAHFIPSPILPGPKRVVYSALTPTPESRTCLNNDYPHSVPQARQRNPEHHPRTEFHQSLPQAPRAEVYIYLVNPQPFGSEHTPEQTSRPFSASRTILVKDTLAKRVSVGHTWESSNQRPRGQVLCDTHPQRKSIWERKHQTSTLQLSPDYEKLAGSSDGASLIHNTPLLADMTRGGSDTAPPTINK
ncbi:uncharacterized protein LOC112546169 [Pelodiscus sinensis]|uniref:uncharacterized protein LOC112546169 n=1 Tax=Pelodiscus sinensis TaxID=13735 RepID=UPI000D7225F6|nr:uncharacterized protein LOC112546169 [Pelodiscus sinensis]|eukprot:XP_025041556.1 uncharacterized protein LOC112546169 [Pelodiscus sinensis]